MHRSRIVCLVACLGSLAASAPAASRTVTFTGRVLDARGKPAVRATVYLSLYFQRAKAVDPLAAIPWWALSGTAEWTVRSRQPRR